MPKRGQCQVCLHPEVAEIDRLLISGEEGGTRKLAERFGVSRGSLNRHRKHHMARALAAASGAVVTRVDPDPGGLLQQLAALERRVTAMLDKAEKNDDIALALKAATELRNQVELLAKLAGEISGTGLGRADVKRIVRELAEVVKVVVRDPEQLGRIQEGWKRVRLF